MTAQGKAALLELRDRLAKATGPDRELDADLWLALNNKRDENVGDPSFRKRGSVLLYDIKGDDRLNWFDVPKLTEGLDAAVTLVPDKQGYMLRDYRDGAASALINYPPRAAMKQTACVGSTPALALCLARIEYELAKEGQP